MTVEAAIALCSLALVACMLLAGIKATVDHIRCVDAAAQAARLLARGDHAAAREIAARTAPSGAELVVDVTGDRIRAEVTAELVPGVALGSVAYAIAEPGEVPE